MRMFHNKLNLEMTRGDTFGFGVDIVGIGQELESAYFTVKNNFDDKDFIFQKSLNNGITLDSYSGDDYIYRVRIAPSDTEELEPKKYYYDLEISVNGDRYTLLKGILEIEFDIRG